MSERWGDCRLCQGDGQVRDGEECPRCGGTGYSGDATFYLEKERERDRANEEREQTKKEKERHES